MQTFKFSLEIQRAGKSAAPVKTNKAGREVK